MHPTARKGEIMRLSTIIRRAAGSALVALGALLLAPALAAAQHEHTAPALADGNYGGVHFVISCSPQAQAVL